VHLLNPSNDLLKNRFGHTELSTAMVVMAELIPSATICEMMGDDGNALRKDAAMKYGKENKLSFITGEEIIEAWEKWSE
jgi:3,4-dihydroxy 2-butanone 4-phosphate synthase